MATIEGLKRSEQLRAVEKQFPMLKELAKALEYVEKGELLLKKLKGPGKHPNKDRKDELDKIEIEGILSGVLRWVMEGLAANDKINNPTVRRMLSDAAQYEVLILLRDVRDYIVGVGVTCTEYELENIQESYEAFQALVRGNAETDESIGQ